MLQALQHWWSGGTFPGYAKTRVKYYVDGEDMNSTVLNLPLGLAHGQDDVTQDNGQVRHLLPYPLRFRSTFSRTLAACCYPGPRYWGRGNPASAV